MMMLSEFWMLMHLTQPVDIPAGPLGYTVNEWSRQSDFQVLFDFQSYAYVKTNAVRGRYLSLIALRVMLRGTGLGFEVINNRTVGVINVGPIQCHPELAEKAPLPPCYNPLPTTVIRGTREVET
jgi:hypothetical protein